MAQSAVKTPLGLARFWDSCANPITEMTNWLGTLKLAVMAGENPHVDKL